MFLLASGVEDGLWLGEVTKWHNFACHSFHKIEKYLFVTKIIVFLPYLPIFYQNATIKGMICIGLMAIFVFSYVINKRISSSHVTLNRDLYRFFFSNQENLP